MAVRIDMDWCINCHRCRRVCSSDAIVYIVGSRRAHVVKPEDCFDCDRCIAVCPAHCIHYDASHGTERANGVAVRESSRPTSGLRPLAVDGRRRAGS